MANDYESQFEEFGKGARGEASPNLSANITQHWAYLAGKQARANNNAPQTSSPQSGVAGSLTPAEGFVGCGVVILAFMGAVGALNYSLTPHTSSRTLKPTPTIHSPPYRSLPAPKPIMTTTIQEPMFDSTVRDFKVTLRNDQAAFIDDGIAEIELSTMHISVKRKDGFSANMDFMAESKEWMIMIDDGGQQRIFRQFDQNRELANNVVSVVQEVLVAVTAAQQASMELRRPWARPSSLKRLKTILSKQ